MQISIVDYHCGNITSVKNALCHLGFEYKLASHPDEITSADFLLLPGVGSFEFGMRNLHHAQLIKPIQNYAKSGRPLLGICLGMQLLATFGNEGAKQSEGLNLIAGNIIRFNAHSITVPHMGWNSIQIPSSTENKHLQKFQNKNFYFVHSYHFDNVATSDIFATTMHGQSFPSIVKRDRIIGVQFHPEKSSHIGLQLLKSFIDSLWEFKQC